MICWINGTIEWQSATAFFHFGYSVRDNDLMLELHTEFSSEVLVHSDYRILILGPKIGQSSIQYPGLLYWWNDCLIDQASDFQVLFFFIIHPPIVFFSIYQNNTWTIICLVDETIEPATQHIILKVVRFQLECRAVRAECANPTIAQQEHFKMLDVSNNQNCSHSHPRMASVLLGWLRIIVTSKEQ